MKRFNQWYVVKINNGFAVQKYSWWGKKACNAFVSKRNHNYIWRVCNLYSFCVFPELIEAKRICGIKNHGLCFPKVDDESEITEEYV